MNSIKQIEVIYDNRLVGRLALTKEGLCAFEYSAEWLNTGFSISPFELPLRSGVFIAKPRPFEGEFGVFDDCLPDGWGVLILDRYLQQNGIPIHYHCLTVLHWSVRLDVVRWSFVLTKVLYQNKSMRISRSWH